jgi:hypothetical protein
MLIKTIDYVNDNSVILLNINIDSYTLIFVDDNKLTLRGQKKENYSTITFETKEMAENARDRIFNTYGLQSPYNKYLDLTSEAKSVDEDEYYYYTLRDLAKKLKIDPRLLRIVDDAEVNNITDEPEEDSEGIEDENVGEPDKI